MRKISLALALSVVFCLPAAAQQSIRIATEGAYPPFNSTDASGNLVGFEIDLAKDLCSRMKLQCEVIAQDWDGIIPGLNAGKYNAIMAGMAVTDKRAEVIGFSEPYGATLSTFLVPKTGALAKLPNFGKRFSMTADQAGGEKVLEELKPLLKGKVIGVQISTNQSSFLERYLKGVVELREYKTTDQHDLDLASGRIDAVFTNIIYANTVITGGNKDVMLAGPRFYGGLLGNGIAVGLRKTDTALKSKFDTAIRESIADGTTAKLSEKWFGYDITPR